MHAHAHAHTHTRTCHTHAHTAPSRPPCNFAVITSTSHTITLEWDAPPPDSQNGVVTQYFLAYACTTPTSWRNCSTTVPRVIPANGQLGEVEVDNLIPYTEYWFQIAAETHAGKGPTASLLYNTTQDSECVCARACQCLPQLWHVYVCTCTCVLMLEYVGISISIFRICTCAR